LKDDGTVVAWGEADEGGLLTSSPSDIVNIYNNDHAFAAVDSAGNVTTWGDSGDGGDSLAVSSQLFDVIDIVATQEAFAALKSDGSVVTWGKAGRGGDSSTVAQFLQSGVVKVYATQQAFAARLDNGTVVAWGEVGDGGDASAVQAQLHDITDVFSNEKAFAAINSTGAVITWGDTNAGGDSSAVAQNISQDVVSVAGYPFGAAFAALTSGGAVYTWGSGKAADSSSVGETLQTTILSITPNANAFAVRDFLTLSPTSSPTMSPTPLSDSPTTSFPTIATNNPTLSPTVSPTLSPTTGPSVSPTKSPVTVSPTADFTIGQLKVSDNMDILNSASDVGVKVGAFIIHPHMDAIVTMDATRNQTLLRSAILTSLATGYIGLKIWEETPLGKVLHQAYDLTWNDKTCVMRGEPCDLLPLNNGEDNTVLAEWRAPALATNITSPYIVTWVDPTGFVRAMKPVFGDELLTYQTTEIEGGRDYSFNSFWQIFQTYILVLVALLICVGALLVWACLRLRRLRSRKSRFVLDTRQYRTVDGKVPKRKLGSQIEKTDRIKWYHWLYIVLVFLVQATIALLFTITFAALIFLSINQSHFDVLKQYPDFADKRDAQLTAVTAAIEAHYQAEMDRIDSQFSFLQTSCIGQDVVMANAYDSEKAAVRAFHDQQFDAPPSGVSSLDEISSEFACNVAEDSGAVYEKNSISYTTAVEDDGDIEFETLIIDDRFNESQVVSNLSFWCSEANWCKGYSYDRDNRDYYLFNVLPTPFIPVGGGPAGVCSVVTREEWPTIAAVFGNLTELQAEYILTYENEVANDIADFNKLLAAPGNESKNAMNVILDRAPLDAQALLENRTINNYNEFTSNTRTVTTDSGTVTTTRNEVILQVPDIEEEAPLPILEQAQAIVGNLTQAENEVANRTNNSVSILNQMGIEVVDVNLTTPVVPSISEYIEYPTYNFPSVPFLAALIALVLIFDITWVMIRWANIAASTGQYIIGIKTQMNDRDVGKPTRWVYELFCKQLFCCGCVASCYRCCMELDVRVWNLIYKVFRVLVLVSIAFVLAVLYFTLDGIINADTLAAFGVFGSMTLQQEIQRTIRNDEITFNANEKNTLGFASLTIPIEGEGARILGDQFIFNVDERARVEEWNNEYCVAATDYVLGVHALELKGSLSGVGNTVNTTLFELESETFGIQKYFIDRVSLDWSYSGSDGSAELQYRLFLTDENTTNPENATYSSVRTVLGSQSNTISFTNVLALFMGIEIISVTDGDFQLTTLSVGGRGPPTDFVCPKVTWRELNFNPNDHLGNCGRVDPIHGFMMRIWDRSDWSDDLTEAHRPFVDAVRNIMLSPFVILLGAVLLYMGVYIIIFVLEWVFMSAGIIRQARYVEVPVLVEYYDRKKEIEMSDAAAEAEGGFNDQERNTDEDGKSVGSRSPARSAGRIHEVSPQASRVRVVTQDSRINPVNGLSSLNRANYNNSGPLV